MMEFTLSRVTMSVCALLLLASLAPYLDMNSRQRMDQEAGSLTESFDSLLCAVARSEAEIWLDGSEVVPKGWTVEISPGRMVLDNGDRTYNRELTAPYGGQAMVFDHDSSLLVYSVEEGGVVTVHLQKVDTMSSTASPSLETSSWSL